MAFWDAERQRLNGFGKPIKRPNVQLQQQTPAQRQAAQRAAEEPGEESARAAAASIPERVKKPTDVVLPPPSKQKTQAVLTSVKQNIDTAKAVTAQVNQNVTQVKQVTGKLKGFFGFGAANITKQQKVQVTQQGKQIADQASKEAKTTVIKLQENKGILAQQKQSLLNDKKQIINENIKLKTNIVEKQKHKGAAETELARIPKTITETKQVQVN